MASVADPSFNENNNRTHGYFTNENGHRIFCKYWCSDVKSPRALVFMCHGAGEHCLYYGEIAELLKAKDIFVFGHDHQGHGQSGGPRMHITDLRHYVRDIYQHIDMVKREHLDLPVFLIGHSMGGAVSILCGLDRPDYFSGIILISPCVTPEQDTVGPIRIFFGTLLAKVFPQFPVLWLNHADISRDKAVCQKYKDDPLNYHGGLKARWALSLLNAVKEIETKLNTIKWPFLVLHGDSDKIVNSKGSETLYREAASIDKTFKIYPGAYHQLHYEIEPVASQCRQDIIDWLTTHLPERGLSPAQ